ncbi:PTS lactose/cellobiose transporter subunit IIA [Lacticaseibacillus hulanensis]|uniref:PTS lactose/cellobiose transporter subunit IIA n=1 Tax=Lacticaseibacillus hulanensis TaxID=2493111 RepID=UPI000FDAA2F2|nr:PTS lactose/cellobiose transporter subunit IIA [Lacticaseibacillus hulanensis]
MAEQEADETTIMSLIMAGGNAKSSAFEAIYAAKKGDFDEAHAKLKEADNFMVDAHNAQTNMLTQEAQGNHVKVNLLMVHAQDHVMNAITFRDLAGEIVTLYERVAQQEK